MSVFPFFKQLDSMDCGPSCLKMIAKHYGKNYSLQSLRSRSFITRSGVSMLGISNAAEDIGFRTLGYRLSWEQLRDEVPLPCIGHWNQRHFVVIYGIKKQRRIPCIFNRTPPEGLKSNRSRNYLIYVADPASGLLKYTEKEFLRCWYSNQKEGIKEGAVLLLEPTQEFFLL